MSLKTNLPKWIFASVAKHFVDGLSSNIFTFVEGTSRKINDESDWIEIRIDGPIIKEHTKNEYTVLSEVNLLVCTQLLASSPFKHPTNVGLAANLFTNIKIYRYGSDSEDDGTVVGCFNLQPASDKHGRIEISNMGQIDPTLKLLQSTVEGHYSMSLKE